VDRCLRGFLAGMLCASLLVALGTSHAQDVKARTLRFAHQNSKEDPQGQGVQKFAGLVALKSDGKLRVAPFPGGTLGGDLQTVSSLQGGTIDMTVLNAGLLVGLVKEFAILDLPFLFNDPKEADAIVDGPIGKKLEGMLPAKGLIGLGYWELGFRNLSNSRRPVARLEDIQGLKLRVLQSPLFIDLWTALGANPVPMPFPEVYTALEQKVVDGQENPVTVIADSKFQEVQKYLTLTQHLYNPQSVLISKRTWDKLSAEERNIVQSAADEARTYQRQLSRRANTAAVELLKKGGMQVVELSPRETARIRERIKPVLAKYSSQIGEPLVKELNGELAKIRGGK
jgi:TRAP-type transport system periplasmic protein